MAAPASLNRRRFARYRVEPMYSPVTIRLTADGPAEVEGHAYDLSEGGCRFDADRPLLPGTPLSMSIQLPGSSETGLDRPIEVIAECVWIEDEDDPAPVRTAARFIGFRSAQDRERLLRHFSTGQYRLVA